MPTQAQKAAPEQNPIVQQKIQRLQELYADAPELGSEIGKTILGCFDPAANQITLLQGWDWYAGADPTRIGSAQYDFETTVTHELGHALGLGEAGDPTSAHSPVTPSRSGRRPISSMDQLVGSKRRAP